MANWFKTRDAFSLTAAILAVSGLCAILATVMPTAVLPQGPVQGMVFKPLAMRPPPKAPDLTSYAAISTRPLFNDGRRKDPPPPPPKPIPPPDVDNYRLVGLVISGNSHLALVARSSGGGILRLRTGDRLDGWTVTAVNPKGLLLNAPGAVGDLHMFRFSGAATSRTGAATADAAGTGTDVQQDRKVAAGRFLGMKIFDVPKTGTARIREQRAGAVQGAN